MIYHIITIYTVKQKRERESFLSKNLTEPKVLNGNVHILMSFFDIF